MGKIGDLGNPYLWHTGAGGKRKSRAVEGEKILVRFGLTRSGKRI